MSAVVRTNHRWARAAAASGVLVSMLVSLLALGLTGAGAAYAAGTADPSGSGDLDGTGGSGARIAQTVRTADGLDVVVDVPAGADVDPADVTASVDGEDYPSTTTRLSDDDASVDRTAVIAIDTSDSMAGARIEAAKQAATAFVDAAPDDVSVGIVTFDSQVTTALEPTTDRDRTRDVIDQITLRQGTRLYDGLAAALSLADDADQRSVLVLSDGADTSSDLSLARIRAAATRAGTPVRAVALQQTPAALTTLRLLAVGGGVVRADTEALASVFTSAADALGRQLGVRLEVPQRVADRQVEVSVRLPSSLGVLTATSTLLATGTGDGSTASADVVPTVDGEARDLPRWALWIGLTVAGVGLLVALVLLVPRRPAAPTVEERLSTYSATAGGASGPGGSVAVAAKQAAAPEEVLAGAKQAAAQLLRRNRSLEARIARRLEGAGSGLKPSEWLLLHLAIFLISALVGLVLGGGSVVVGLLFMLAGLVLPWVYLGLRRSRRRAAFGASLPDTLQLMSGSLSAGLSLAQSVDTIVREGADPIAAEFRRVLVETRLGVSLEDAFDGVAARFDSRDFAWVVMAIRIQRQVGGNLAELFDTVAATMREREYMRRQVDTLAAEGKLSALILGALPVLFFVYLVLTKGDFVAPLFTDPLGIAMLAGGVVWLGIGIFIMSRIVKVEV